ncbi:MAG: hypothetical protein WBP94_06515 [Rhodomicrobiaceae bacterium]
MHFNDMDLVDRGGMPKLLDNLWKRLFDVGCAQEFPRAQGNRFENDVTPMQSQRGKRLIDCSAARRLMFRLRFRFLRHGITRHRSAWRRRAALPAKLQFAAERALLTGFENLSNRRILSGRKKSQCREHGKTQPLREHCLGVVNWYEVGAKGPKKHVRALGGAVQPLTGR